MPLPKPSNMQKTMGNIFFNSVMKSIGWNENTLFGNKVTEQSKPVRG
jgi:hypothetical protein